MGKFGSSLFIGNTNIITAWKHMGTDKFYAQYTGAANGDMLSTPVTIHYFDTTFSTATVTLVDTFHVLDTSVVSHTEYLTDTTYVVDTTYVNRKGSDKYKPSKVKDNLPKTKNQLVIVKVSANTSNSGSGNSNGNGNGNSGKGNNNGNGNSGNGNGNTQMILDTTEIIVTYLDTVEVIDTTIYTDSAYTVARDSSYEIMTVLERQRFVDNKHYYQVNNTNATTGDLPLSLSTLPIPATVCWLYGTMAASSATSSLPTR